MNLDLLTLLENIVSGFVSFFYSLLRTLFETARRPIRGPFRLYRRYRAPRSRQIGGVTFLCMGFFLVFYVLFSASDLNFRSLLDQIVKAIRELPNTNARKLWPVIVSSLTSMIVIDAATRFFLDLHHLRRSRCDMVLAAAEYSMFWATTFAVVGAIVLRVWLYPVLGQRWTVDPSALLMIPAVILLSVPAATILNAGARRAASGQVRRRGRVPWLRTLAGVTLILFIAAYAGTAMWAAVSVNPADGR
jgi:hypothetical protein